MKTKETKQKIEEAKGDWNEFLDWMYGQTVGQYPDGDTDWYECDIDNFISQISRPAKERQVYD